MVKVKGKNSLINQFVNAFDVTNMHFLIPRRLFLSPGDYSAINSLSPQIVECQEGCILCLSISCADAVLYTLIV